VACACKAPESSDHCLLTPRESEVAVLVAQGKTSPEIAAELSVTVKTVERHLDHIRSRLGARNRAQIAALVGVLLTLAWQGAPWG
jgi:DNA-binding NarL/FixJ family response regulator